MGKSFSLVEQPHRKQLHMGILHEKARAKFWRGHELAKYAPTNFEFGATW
jgi:hypothetical protein